MHLSAPNHLKLCGVPERIVRLSGFELLGAVKVVTGVLGMLGQRESGPVSKALGAVVVRVMETEIVGKFPPHDQLLEKGRAPGVVRICPIHGKGHTLGRDLPEMEVRGEVRLPRRVGIVPCGVVHIQRARYKSPQTGAGGTGTGRHGQCRTGIGQHTGLLKQRPPYRRAHVPNGPRVRVFAQARHGHQKPWKQPVNLGPNRAGCKLLFLGYEPARHHVVCIDLNDTAFHGACHPVLPVNLDPERIHIRNKQ